MLCMEIVTGYNQNSTKHKIHCIRKIRGLFGVLFYVLKPEGPLWNTLRMRCYAFVTETEQIQ